MRYECDFRFGYVILLVSAGLLVSSGSAEAQLVRAEGFFKRYCLDCHQGAEAEASLDLKALPVELADPKNFARWEQLYDRVAQGEMPPKDAPQPASPERQSFLEELSGKLTAQHQSVKGTVLRRLNRREYENTLNDLFGTQERLASLLPEDGRTHEFDNVGAGLGISMVHLETYIKAMDQVLNAAIVSTIDRPAVQKIEASFKGSSESERFVGSVWKELSDGSIVRFEGGGYPSGMMRGSNIRDRGRYRVTVRGYAYRSPAAISFSVEGTSFARGSEKPVYGFFSFEPGTPEQAPQEITFEAFIETNYMLAIEPYGISDPERYKRKTVDEYEGPGLAIHSVTLEGPLIEEYPTRGHQLLFSQLQREEIMPRNPRDRERPYYRPQFNVTAQNLDQDVNAVLTEVATKAFRRPVRAEEVQPYRKLFDAEYQKENNLEQSLRTAVIALFCSPDFLYLQEPAGPLDDFAVASRLSYFLNRTAPDAELLKVAAEGKLKNPQELQLQTLRLLKHPHFGRFITDYCENWLNLREMDFTNPDNSLFPEFDSYLRYSMPLETEAFLRELIEGNHGIRNLVASDFAMLNSRLAEHYNLPPIEGSEIRKVPLPKESLRGGFLTQSSILKVSANGTNTSPVVRGVFVMERFLGETPPPPPPGVPGVEPDIRGASTLRALLDKHRALENCRACHQRIDPPGFALEEFNPIGGYRDRYRSLGEGDRVNTQVNGRNVRYKLGPDVDSSGTLLSGESFQNYAEFRNLLASSVVSLKWGNYFDFGYV